MFCRVLRIEQCFFRFFLSSVNLKKDNRDDSSGRFAGISGTIEIS